MFKVCYKISEVLLFTRAKTEELIPVLQQLQKIDVSIIYIQDERGNKFKL